jgi:DNA invertase Pin-like site-specific DNA recombinase
VAVDQRVDKAGRQAAEYGQQCALGGYYASEVCRWLTSLEKFDHLGVRFISVQHQIDTASPMGRAMFTITGAWPNLSLR